ncbi:MAG: hypothetical protein AB7I27_09610 [Bacteriovoracaceae bacterium]
MKTSLTKLKNSFLLFSLLSLPLWAKPVAQVTEISGQVFAMTSKGETISLKPNSHIEDKCEIMVEEGAHITLMDYYDATYHLIGGSHLKFFDKAVQLKRGKAWIKSQNSKIPLALTTANGNADFWKSEFIATFDQSTSRSQFLVVNGEIEVSNVLDRNMKYTVSAGQFSLVDPEVENGIPRAPTKVGLSSLNLSLAEFKKLPVALKSEPANPVNRQVASVEEKNSESVKKGEIIFISSNRLPASVSGGAYNYFKKKVHTKAKKSSQVMVPIRIFGSSIKTSSNTPTLRVEIPAPRKPASIPTLEAPKKAGPISEISIDQEFAESLKKQSAEQPKYSKELDSLIQDLKSY